MSEKIIKKKQGAMEISLVGKNKILLNWNDGMIEVYHNGDRKYIIDTNKD